MNEYFSEIFTGGKSLLVGLGVTFRALISPVVTVQYPREKVDISPAMRGHIDLVKDPETEQHRCISCGLCMKNCPCGAIVVKGEKQEGVKGKILIKFNLDFSKCSLCGLCVESCKKSAIEFSDEYEIAAFSRDAFHFDLLQRFEQDVTK
jgi:formate hydrogenlyase subunit 6/NADH:ubiquinone oxidoreductase subunit I